MISIKDMKRRCLMVKDGGSIIPFVLVVLHSMDGRGPVLTTAVSFRVGYDHDDTASR
jgi:hypothetical protein